MTFTLSFDWPNFLHQYWQKSPVVIRQGLPHFCDPITPDELAGLAMEEEIDSRLVCHQQRKNWQVTHGPFTDFSQLAEQDGTLLVQAVNHWHTESAQLLVPFQSLPHWRLDDLMISYSTVGGGVGPHVDQYDVFIIQGLGKRHWRVGNNNQALTSHLPHPHLLQVAAFEAIIDVELLPGDILYIPPGFPHEGYAIEPSLNYSVGFRAPNGQELLSSFADYLLQHEYATQRYSDANLQFPSQPAQLSQQEIDQLQQLLLKQIQQPNQFIPWLGEFLSTSRHELDILPVEPAFSSEEIKQYIRQGQLLYRLAGIRCLQLGDDYFINGEKLPRHPALAILLQWTPIAAHQLQMDLYDDDFYALLTHFINQGYWYFAD